MPEPAWRQSAWAEIGGPWDVAVIGGGITGAGILRLAVNMGLRALLVEQNDFAWGTSSRSGKLVHGGLRYLKQGQIGVTRHSVRERERLIREAPGLVEPMEFLLPVYGGQGALRAAYRLGLGIYDLLAGRKTRRSLSREDFAGAVPAVDARRLEGGLGYQDARADDARMVLRLIFEAAADGGRALNYAPVTDLLLAKSGRVCGIVVQDRLTGKTAEVMAGVVINSTGAWADRLRLRLGRAPVIRPLRGSHLVFSRRSLPLDPGVSFLHPRDRRPVYVFPWEGVTLVGTTDLDCTGDLDADPSILPGEKEYLLEAVHRFFPALNPREGELLSSFTGIRPVVGSGKKDPSREARDMLVVDDEGLLTVTGGKLTTFRLLALRALAAAGDRLPIDLSALEKKRVYRENDPAQVEISGPWLRLAGRYGRMARRLAEEAAAGDLEEIPGTVYLWAELKHAARHEMAVHLEDLMLRRLRLGLVLPDGGAGLLERVKGIVCPAMGWDEAGWRDECARYLEVWRRAYSPGGEGGSGGAG